MSKLQKTPSKIDSNKKNAILYSFMLRLTDGFHDNNAQTGIRNVVKIIINSASPSIPKTTLLFDKTNQSSFSKNWNPETVGSKNSNKKIETLKISKDQKREKFRINLIFVLFVKERTNTPISGNVIRKDNIMAKKWTNIWNNWHIGIWTLNQSVKSRVLYRWAMYLFVLFLITKRST